MCLNVFGVRVLHTQEVTGSSPVAPTIHFKHLPDFERSRFRGVHADVHAVGHWTVFVDGTGGCSPPGTLCSLSLAAKKLEFKIEQAGGQAATPGSVPRNSYSSAAGW